MGLFDGIIDSISGGVDQFTGHAGAQAARKAAREQQMGLERGLGVAQQQYQQGYNDLAGYRGAGQTGTQGLLAGLADPNSYFGYQFQGFDPSGINIQDDPGYQFRLQQGLGAAQNSQAARGLSQSGGALKELQDYASGMASQEYNNAYNRNYQTWQGNQAGRMNQASLRAGQLSNLASLGMGATQQGNQLGQNYANQYLTGQMGIGDARAAGLLGAQNSLSQGYQNVTGLLKDAIKGASAYYTGGLSGLAGSMGAGGPSSMAGL